METDNRKYLYADILIAMAHADGNLDETKKSILEGICNTMELDSSKIEKMIMTPRTMDVIESILEDVTDENFKRCLIKDCDLIAYADGVVVPAESEILKRINHVMKVDESIVEEIHNWVKTAISQKEKAEELFG